MENIKILHLLSSNKFSGAENVACQIIKMFNKDVNVKMSYCCPKGEIKEVLAEKKIKYYPMRRFDLINLKKIIDTFHPTIIHAHDVTACLLATPFCYKTKIVAHIHGNHDNMKIFSLKSLLFLLSSPIYNKIIWVSNSALKEYFFSNLVKYKSIVLYNVINQKEIMSKVKEDKNTYSFDCVFIGRLCEIKNPKRAVKIFKELHDKIGTVKIAIVGDGILYNEVYSLIKKYNIDNNVQMLGFVANPLKILKSSKVLIMTSIYEGTPMVALEAMSLGVPIVATPVDGLVDLVDQGQTGFLSNNDAILVDNIYSLISDDILNKKISNKTLEKFLKINKVSKYKEAIIDGYTKW